MVEHVQIEGGASLIGEVKISGSKNASLPIIAATLICDGHYELDNIPRIADTLIMLQALEMCGVTSNWSTKSLSINTSKVFKAQIPKELTSRFRGGLYLLSGLLTRSGEVSLGLPGGCNFDRPFDYHVAGLRQLGASVDVTNDKIEAKVSRFKGATIYLPFPSLGTTCNLVIAASKAEGRTQIINASCAPEVVDLCNFLKSMGAMIEGIGSSHIIIHGVDNLYPSAYTVMADRVEAATFLFATVMAGGQVTLSNCPIHLIRPLDTLLVQTSAIIQSQDKGIIVKADKNAIFPQFNLVVGPDPGYWTDWQPHITAFALLCDGECIIKDQYYFGKRFNYVRELTRLGANIVVRDNLIRVKGPNDLIGTDVIATDIQGGVSLVLAGLIARGTTRVFDIDKLDRGYVMLENKLLNIGAKIRRH